MKSVIGQSRVQHRRIKRDLWATGGLVAPLLWACTVNVGSHPFGDAASGGGQPASTGDSSVLDGTSTGEPLAGTTGGDNGPGGEATAGGATTTDDPRGSTSASAGDDTTTGDPGESSGNGPTAQSCCEVTSTLGCDDQAVQDCVCADDPSCCQFGWTQDCVYAAVQCGARCPVSSPDCCQAHAGGGCSDAALADCVCDPLPGCCTDGWFDICAQDAIDRCGAACLD